MKIQRSLDVLHPVLADLTKKIQKEIILAHNMPIRLFETGRKHERHEMLVNKGKTKDVMSKHLFNLKNNPPLYATALDYVVYCNGKWSWNLRDSTVISWYQIFGNLVLDLCPELEWGGSKRKAINYCHFELKYAILIKNIGITPCVIS